MNLKMPISTEDILKLKAGDEVKVTGTIFTARDKAHMLFMQEDFDRITDGVIYHCGPVVRKSAGGYEIVAAGPTTSARMSIYEPDVINKYGIKAIIGKGGMDEKTLEALRGRAVYLSAIGGAGLIYTSAIRRVVDVHHLDFGVPEAIWELEVADFPAIVTMDAHGNSLHEQVRIDSERKLHKLIRLNPNH
ncbi:MAG: FumA C-terminus/TtdB family hydratase beta subunit [archaeon]